MKKGTIAKAAIVAGLVVGVLGLCAVGWVISGSWVSPFEKRAIRNALVEVEGIRKFHGVESEGYRAQIAKAKAAVENCKKREITEYDGRIESLLEMDLDSAVQEKRAWDLPDSNPAKQRMVEAQAKSDRMIEKIIREDIE